MTKARKCFPRPLRNGAQPGLEPATCKSQVRCPTNSKIASPHPLLTPNCNSQYYNLQSYSIASKSTPVESELFMLLSRLLVHFNFLNPWIGWKLMAALTFYLQSTHCHWILTCISWFLFNLFAVLALHRLSTLLDQHHATLRKLRSARFHTGSSLELTT